MTSFATQSNIDMGGPGILGSDVSGASRRKSKRITIGAGLTLSTGVLSNSLDLSGYVPYTGATGAVNLGTNALTVGVITSTYDAGGFNAARLNGPNSTVLYMDQYGQFAWSDSTKSRFGSSGTDFHLPSDGVFGISSGNVFGTVTNKLSRGSTGPTWDLRSDGGTRIRNLANSSDAALTCGAITASGNVNIGTNSLVGAYSGVANSAKWLTGSDGYGSFYISPDNAAFKFAPPAAGAMIASIDYVGRVNAVAGFAIGGHDYSSTDVRYLRNTTGPKASIRADGGLEIKNLDASADAALTCGAVTASGDLNIGSNTMYVGGSGYFRFADYVSMRSGGNWGLLDVAPMNGSQSGTLRLYNGIHSLTNYERLEVGQGVAGDAFIRTAAGGTGTRRNLTLDAPVTTCTAITASGPIQETPTQSALDPTITDIPTGKARRWYNSTLNEVRDWVNIGGTLFKSAAYT